MISKAYEKADFKILYFELEDVITASAVIHTTTAPATTAPTTLPGTTSGGGASLGGNSNGEVDWSDFFQ